MATTIQLLNSFSGVRISVDVKISKCFHFDAISSSRKYVDDSMYIKRYIVNEYDFSCGFSLTKRHAKNWMEFKGDYLS